MSNELEAARRAGMKLETEECYVAAAMVLERVVQATPDDAFAWLILSDTYKVLGKLTACGHALQEALNICSPNKRWIVLARLATLDVKCGRFLAAEDWFCQAMREKPLAGDTWIDVLRANNLLRLERFTAAEELLRSLIESGRTMDDEDEVYNQLGMALLGQDRINEARIAFESSARLASDESASAVGLTSVSRIEEAREIIARLDAAKAHS